MSNSQANGYLINAAGAIGKPIMSDWQHASKLYVDELYKRAPKFGFLYFVNFNIVRNDTIMDQGWKEEGSYQVGLLAKKIDLPKFSIETETLNQYNRKTVIQKGIKYNNINVEFHDDHGNIANNLWVNYYKHYYFDSQQQPEAYHDTKYQNTDYQYGRYNNDLKPSNFFGTIEIFVLNQKRFTKYTLVNPKITEWKHDEVAQDAGSKILQNSMTIAYENVLYDEGVVDADFAGQFYDKTQSPTTLGPDNEVLYKKRLESPFDKPGKDTVFSNRPRPRGFDNEFGKRDFKKEKGAFLPSGNFDKTYNPRTYGAIRPKAPGQFSLIAGILMNNYLNQNGLTRQTATAYNIAGSVMKATLSSGAGKYADPPSTETAPGVFQLPGGVGINIFKGFNTTVDGGIRANPAAILFPSR